MESESPSDQRQPWLDTVIGTGLAIVALGIYLATLAPTVLEADGGEFQFVPWLPGIAHPTGYPLYTLLGWLWSHLFSAGEVAWRMNLLSALYAAVAAGMLYGAAHGLLDRTLPETPPLARQVSAAVTALTFAVTPTFWSQAIIAEVYTLHALFVVMVLWLALSGRYRGLALTFGLGLTHHLTIVLLAPGLLLYWVYGQTKVCTPDSSSPERTKVRTPDSSLPGVQTLARRRWIEFRRPGLQYLVLVAMPLLLYLYLPLVAPVTPYAQLRLSETQHLTLYENSAQGLWRHITGTVFAAELRPAALGLERVQLAWQLLHREVGWAGLGLALIGLVTLWRRQQAGPLLLTGVGFLSIVVFNLIYFIGDIFVLFIPAWLFICLWLGVGVLGLTNWLTRRFIRSKTIVSEDLLFERLQARLGQNLRLVINTMLPFFFFAMPIWLGLSHWGELDQSRNMAARQRWQTILDEPLPKAAILLSNDRNEMMPMWYYQYVEKRRPDLLGLFPLITPDPAYRNVGLVLDQALASGRPVYLIKAMEGLSLKATLSPEGRLFRATPRKTTPFYTTALTLPAVYLPSVSGEPRSETIQLRGYDIEPAAGVEPGSVITVTLYWQPIQPLSVDYTSYVHLVNSAGQGVSQNDHPPGGVFYPSHLWQIGETLADRHTLAIPADLSPGLYRLKAGLYYQPELDQILGMGDGVGVGLVAVRDDASVMTSLPPNLTQPTNLAFGDSFRLLGYDLAPVAENQLLLNLTWQAKQRQPLNWSVFVHLLDAGGNLIAQTDSQPRGGSYPTTVWTMNEIVNDPHLLTYPPTLEGQYRLAFGLYNPETGERLLITDENGDVLGRQLTLTISL
jgi:hypothetical protein